MTHLFRKRTALLLFACAIVLRLALFFAAHPWTPEVESNVVVQSDARGYHLLGLTLLHEHRFALGTSSAPMTLRTPLYPLFLAAVYGLFGPRPWVAILIQFLIEGLTCVLLYSATRRVTNQRVATITAALYAVDPFLIFFANTLLSDVLFTFLVVLALFLLSKLLTDPAGRGRYGMGALLGAVLGLATLARPVGNFAFIALVLTLVILHLHRSRPAFSTIGTMVALYVITISPWLLRNYLLFGTPSISTSGGYNALTIYIGPMYMEKHGGDSWMARDRLWAEADSLALSRGVSPGSLNDFQWEKYQFETAVRHVTSDPAGFAKHFAFGVLHTLTNLGTQGYAKLLGIRTDLERADLKGHGSLGEVVRTFLREKPAEELIIGGVTGLFLVASYVLVAAGLLRGWRPEIVPYLVVCLLLASYFILIIGPAGLCRFRLPAIPCYAIFGGLGAEYLLTRWRHRRSGRSAVLQAHGTGTATASRRTSLQPLRSRRMEQTREEPIRQDRREVPQRHPHR
jgi:4-amino-4-deoxy-L-arabinose transferase-like glycosyltransferase